MKSTRRAISIILSVLMLMTCVSTALTVSASTGDLCDKYATNPNSNVGKKKTITIDGDFSDWSSDMLIAQGAAWDVANHYKGGHENCVLDTYALYASWDSDNLYVGWQMVNTTDTWAREGDGPLSDGGRVLDVPLILALSVDPSSVSMSNKNTDGNPIWGQKMGLEFDQHVDNLLYMSGKPGLGTPALFQAVDANGNTNYEEGCLNFSSNGIEYKMAEGNICDSIIGLDYSEDPSDVYNSEANWVDYKTFEGSSGVHNTKYDSFYEIKIPLSKLGIDASYIENNGIGAMVVATRGESGLDCIPFDDTMLDNATGDYSNDPSTSAEKDDVDTITSSFARIGNLGGSQPSTTAPVTTQPVTTEPTTTEPVSDTLTVNAKSNLFGTASVEAAKDAKTVTVTYDLASALNVVNGQWVLNYDSSKLKLTSDAATIMPYTTDGVINMTDGVIKGNFTNVNTLYDFTTEKPLVQATFEIIGKGSTDVTLDVQELSVGYKSNSVLKYKNAVVNSVAVDLSSFAGFASSSISGKASVVTDQEATTGPVVETLTVNATSNFFPAESKTVNKENGTVTVSYKFSSSLDLVNAEWVLTYDTTKLALNSSNLASLMPNISNAVVLENTPGTVKGNFSELTLVDFESEKDFVTVTFDVIGTGTANVDLYVKNLGIAYTDANLEASQAYIVDLGVVKDVTSIEGFESEVYTTNTVIEDIAFGDVNNDGVINITDATLVQKHAVRLTTLSADMALRADVNHDGYVNISDATLIQKYVAGMVTSF